MCRYWGTDYDWRAREALLNRFDQYTTAIDGLDIHFVHQRSPHPEARPLLITHGWPGSIVEFHKVIEPFTHPTQHGGAPTMPSCDLPDASGLRVLGQADHDRMGCRANR